MNPLPLLSKKDEPMVRVLVVDDEYSLRLLVSTALRAVGYDTFEVESGLEALE
jgi:CheY-like chemotaxis protein